MGKDELVPCVFCGGFHGYARIEENVVTGEKMIVGGCRDLHEYLASMDYVVFYEDDFDFDFDDLQEVPGII